VQEQQLPRPDYKVSSDQNQRTTEGDDDEKAYPLKLLKGTSFLLRSVPVLQENAEYVRLLLPTFQRLLVLLLSLEDEARR